MRFISFQDSARFSLQHRNTKRVWYQQYPSAECTANFSSIFALMVLQPLKVLLGEVA
jgi:hypothetical protein